MQVKYINLVLIIVILFLVSKFYEDYSRRTQKTSFVKEQFHLTEEHRERLMKQFKEEFRRIVLRNEMDRAIELTFLLKQEGREDLAIQHYIGPKDSGQVPYLVPGILSVTQGNSTASVDISDTTKEYIFTVHPDGSVTQITQAAREEQV